MQKEIPTDPWPRRARLVCFLFIAATVLALLSGCNLRRDDSDMPDGRASGVIVRTDALSGCQYLEASGGGLTPRMDRNGKQVCK